MISAGDSTEDVEMESPSSDIRPNWLMTREDEETRKDDDGQADLQRAEGRNPFALGWHNCRSGQCLGADPWEEGCRLSPLPRHLRDAPEAGARTFVLG